MLSDRWIGWLLNLIYAALLLLASPWLLSQQLSGRKRRQQWRQRLLGPDPKPQDSGSAEPVLWVHAVSVGEVNLALRFLPALSEKFPGTIPVLSSTTDTGLQLANGRLPAHQVVRFPFDFSWAIARLFQRVQPSALLLTELEIWPNLLSQASRAGIPVVVINARLSEKSFRSYRRLGWLFRRWFEKLDLVVAQTESYAQRFRALGVPADRVVTAGSIKFDAAETDRENSRTCALRRQFGISDQRPVCLAGSTSAPEEAMVLETYEQVRKTQPNWRLVVVPRHPERFSEVAGLIQQQCRSHGWRFRRRSEIAPSQTAQDWDVLLVDTVGELGAWWGTAEMGFVGGSFGSRGGQSMIEPAAYGVATCFGPRTSNFRDVVALMEEHHAGATVDSQESLTAWLQSMTRDEGGRIAMGQRARQLVMQQAGATERTLSALEGLLQAVVGVRKTLGTKVADGDCGGLGSEAVGGAGNATASPHFRAGQASKSPR